MGVITERNDASMDEREFRERALAIERRLYRTSYMMLRSDADCADAVQEALFKAWRSRDRLRDPQYFETWLTRILINECKQTLRRRRPEAPLSEAIPAPGDEGGPLREALWRLPERFRLPVVLKHMEGYSVREIAAMLSLPQGTVSWRLSRAMKLLRQYLEEEEGAVI